MHFSRTFFFIAQATFLTLAAVSIHAQGSGGSRCDPSLLPQITIATERVHQNLAYLRLIDQQSFEDEMKSGRIGVVLKGIPLNAGYDEFSRRRDSYRDTTKIDYSRDEARALLRQTLSSEQLSAWTTCMTSDVPGVRVVMSNDTVDAATATVYYTGEPGSNKSFTARVTGGTIQGTSNTWKELWGLLGSADTMAFNLSHKGSKGIEIRREQPLSTIRVHVEAPNLTDTALSVPKPPKPPGTVSPRFPVYISKEMITECVSRGNVCGYPVVTLGGVKIDKGVVFTQPGSPDPQHSGHSHATFGVVPGARRLSFTVGNYYSGYNCMGMKPVLVYVSVDGVTKWESNVSLTQSAEVALPPEAKTITLIGNTGDGPVSCDDAVWANVRLD